MFVSEILIAQSTIKLKRKNKNAFLIEVLF